MAGGAYMQHCNEHREKTGASMGNQPGGRSLGWALCLHRNPTVCSWYEKAAGSAHSIFWLRTISQQQNPPLNCMKILPWLEIFWCKVVFTLFFLPLGYEITSAIRSACIAVHSSPCPEHSPKAVQYVWYKQDPLGMTGILLSKASSQWFRPHSVVEERKTRITS